MGNTRAPRRAMIAAGATGAVTLVLALAAQGASHVRLVSRTSSGAPANGYSTLEGNGGTVSHDGRFVAFVSDAPNLPDGDGSTFQAYVRDVRSGKTHFASTKANGDAADGEVFSPAMSAGGRFVVFYGVGNGLPGANPPYGEVWIHDLKTGKTRLVSKDNGGNPGDRDSSYPSVSADGRFVAFQSGALNFPGASSTEPRVYVRDTKRGKTILASKTNTGHPAIGQAYGQLVSSDGRFVVFFSDDVDLPYGNGATDHVYVRDLARRRTILVDRKSNGQAGNGDGTSPSISGNGRFVTFGSFAGNLPGGDGNVEQVYLRDLRAGKTNLVSRPNGGGGVQGGTSPYAQYGHVSGSGRSVVFEAQSTNLPGGGDGSTSQIYVRDLRRGKTRLVSRAANGDPGDDYNEYPSISLDGNWAAFYGGADNLGGPAGYQNVYRAGPIG